MRKYEPDVDHLDVGGLGQAAGDADEQGGEHQEGGQVHRHRRLEEEVLEEVGRVDYGEDKDGGQIDSQDGVQDSSLEDQGHLDSFVPVGGVDVCERPEMKLMITRSKISREKPNQLVMMYWVRTVSDSMWRRWGVIAITEVSSFRTIRLTVHTLCNDDHYC